MGKLVALDVGGSTLLIESSDITYDEAELKKIGYTIKDLNKMLAKMRPFCESIIQNFEALSNKPESASIEFGLGIAGEGNLFVTKVSGEAAIKVTLNWKLFNR